MSEQAIKLSDNAAKRIKLIMSKAEKSAIGVRVGVKSGGCAGMSYIMEYAKEISIFHNMTCMLLQLDFSADIISLNSFSDVILSILLLAHISSIL